MIQVQHISYSYGDHEVLRDISFDAHSGDFVGILGNNGAGKSTLITCLNKIRTPKSGSVLLDGTDVLRMGRLEAARQIAYVGQHSELSQITVFDCVLLGRKPYIKWTVSPKDVSLCEEMLSLVGMDNYHLRYISELSGGELQKVMLARALVQQPKLLLLDEPTSSLDLSGQYEMLALIRRIIRERNICALMVIHDLSLALRFCNHFVLLRGGNVYAQGDTSIVTPDSIRAVYGMEALVRKVEGVPVVVPIGRSYLA